MPYKDREKKNEAQKRYRDGHPEYVAKEKERLKGSRSRYYIPVIFQCSSCGETMNRRRISGLCKPCERSRKQMVVKCQKCGDIFTGDRRSKYCLSCKKRLLPSLLDAMKVYIQRRRSKEKGVAATFTRHDWKKAKQHFNNQCAYCGRRAELEQDHFIPLSAGGAYTKDNIVPACKSCNGTKHDTLPWEWLPRLQYENIAQYLRSTNAA